MRCFGITNFRRCKREQKNAFCHDHRWQPLYYIIGLIIALIISYVAGIIPKIGEKEKINLDSISLKLEAYAHAGALTPDYTPPENIKLHISIDDLYFEAPLEINPKYESGVPSQRNPQKGWTYSNTKLNIDKSENVVYIKDLIGKEIKILLPDKAFRFRTKASGFQIYFYLNNREIFLKSNNSGELKHIFKKSDL